MRYEPFGPWIVPWRFQSTVEEYRALQTGAGLADVSFLATLACAGADRAAFLHRLLTNDVQRLSPGQGCRAALLTPTAKVLAELLLLADPDTLWLLCDLTRAETALAALERYHFAESVTLANRERCWAALALQGPRTLACLSTLTGATIALPQPGSHQRAELDGIPVRLVRHSVAGCGVGVVCLIEAAQAEPVWTWLCARGAAAGLRPVGWDALNTLRIESGEPWSGVDVTEANLLPETGLDAATVSETKGCYVGQEIVARMRTYGSANKKLMGLLLEGEASAAPGDPIVRDGEALGAITSACVSLALHRPIALGYVKRGAYEPGTRVEVVSRAGRVPATVARFPVPGTVSEPVTGTV